MGSLGVLWFHYVTLIIRSIMAWSTHWGLNKMAEILQKTFWNALNENLDNLDWKCLYFDLNFAYVFILGSNTLNPFCGVANICHQVCCLCWGHLSLFRTGRSLLNFETMDQMGDLICNFYTDKIYKCVTLIFAIWSAKVSSLNDCCRKRRS